MPNLFERIFRSRPGEPVSWDNFVKAQMEVPEVALLLAIGNTKKRSGAERIYYAELAGRKRPIIVNRAARRLDWFDKRDVFLDNIKSVGT